MPTQVELSASIPARVEGYVRALGAREAAAFLTRFGGKVIHISAKPKAGSALTRAIGVEKASALKDVFGHGTIKVPMGRAWVARQLDAEGMSRAEIAKKLLVTRESVRLYLSTPKDKASVTEISTIGLDLAKNVFQAHGANAAGAPMFRKKLRRDQVLAFFAAQPPCLVAMEACPGAHHWGREIGKLGHTVKLIAPAYVKPFVKRQKNDAADAEAICEAAQRPTMRFVAVKSEAKQASAVIFRTRDVLVGQRTQLINAIRGHLAEYGLIAPQGPAHIERLIAQIEDPASDIPPAARASLAVFVCAFRHLQKQTAALDAEIATRAKADDTARRLMSVPGIGPLIATAIEALAPPVETFRSGRDFAAWVGLTPVQRSTGGKERLGRTSRMGERTLRRLLIIAASAVVRWAKRKDVPADSWLGQMLARKPPMLVIVAVANKNARIAWALLTKGGIYRAPAVTA